ncbi:PrsW family glutamic-type intramembrane protease [Candidatus Amarobacter glycogenicus]|uniref:PrsW family glutamic-type intramembrane protease n=1 Tax=Candidatus Amarobacter glycogenicus TaxID=3140699 RepID=UPI003135CD9F|nr:PrsW family intramembrane metalloprotease [Dehalococcoidia bacterium]
MRVPRWKFLAPAAIAVFPLFVVIGQLEVNNPERLLALFPGHECLHRQRAFAGDRARCFPALCRVQPLGVAGQRREWSSGVIYGAIGATTVAGIINTLYLVLMAILLVSQLGNGDTGNLAEGLPSLPRGWGVFFDVSVLSVVAPLNEEFWKGMLVAFFFFRRGARACFVWGVLAGTGFNILETFENSLSIVNPSEITQQQLSADWWKFAGARAGTGAVHAAATGMSALGFYGLFRRQGKYLLGYPAGVAIHGAWNFLNFTLAGDAFLSQAGPDSQLLDILSILGLFALFFACIALLWEMPRRLRDGRPAAIYLVLGMVLAMDRPTRPPEAASAGCPTTPYERAHRAAVLDSPDASAALL